MCARLIKQVFRYVSLLVKCSDGFTYLHRFSGVNAGKRVQLCKSPNTSAQSCTTANTGIVVCTPADMYRYSGVYNCYKGVEVCTPAYIDKQVCTLVYALVFRCERLHKQFVLHSC